MTDHSLDSAIASDSKGGPARTVLLAVVLCVPALKVLWTLGGSDHAREALLTMEAANWPGILVGMLLTEPLLTSVLAVLVSRTVSAWLAARHAAAEPERRLPLWKAALIGLVTTLAFALLVATVHNWAWGLATWLVAYLLRLGIVATYYATPGGRRERFATGARHATLLLTAVVLPLAALAAVLDGRSWANVLDCDVNTGHGTERTRLIEFHRESSGATGWDIHGAESVFGANCAFSQDQTVRAPWWRQ
ncbi:hypothetical protein [Streptomyces sp. NPDC058045]|uniref:hypothetical protein n=1 Tax=Streptomyces sp. NPDC058045 TaxID=3346311 RepID=UPI0036E9F1F1